MRSDLASLTEEDLIALTNRGTVKRAAKEADLEHQLTETPEGTVTVKWSDGPECRIDGGATLDRGKCTCNATSLCRHLVRSVLAYQRSRAGSAKVQDAGAPWDPGAITDASLAACLTKAKLAKAKKQFEAGIAAELVRSAKPTARLYQHAVTVRFLVPDDPRYTHCDCAEASPCPHVPLAVWAFRLLPAGENSGVLENLREETAAPIPVLDELEAAIVDLLQLGIAGASEGFVHHLERLAERLRGDGLFWPADIVDDLIEEHQLYRAEDALFRPDRIADLIGELMIRRDAIAAGIPALPQFFLRGAEMKRETRAGSGRYLGVGTSVALSRHGPELAAYLVEADSGTVVTIARRFRDPEDRPARPFSELAQTPIAKGVNLAQLGSGQLLAKGGKRSASHRLALGRARAVVNPQTFEWTVLRPPVSAEDFEEVRAHLLALPPPSLRPRWVASDVFVVPLVGAESVQFSAVRQSIMGWLIDRANGRAQLIHPYTTRGREGAELLLGALGKEKPAWISARMYLDHGELIARPLGVVFGDRLIQPWIDRGATSASTQEATAPLVTDPIDDFLSGISDRAADLVLTGLSRADYVMASDWRTLESRAEKIGSTLLLDSIRRLAAELEKKQSEIRWSHRESAETLLRLLAHLELARGLRS